MSQTQPLRKTFSGQGRPRRTDVQRYPSGQIVHAHRKPKETEEDILSVALGQPHRRGAKDPRSRFHGYEVGRMFLRGKEGGIDKLQLNAAERYTRLAIRHARLVTGSLPRFPSLMAERIAGGLTTNPEPDDDDIMQLRRDWGDAQSALMDTGEHYEATRTLFKACILDQELSPKELGTFRAACNVLARLWDIHKEVSEKGI
jgi:hypothetical protein